MFNSREIASGILVVAIAAWAMSSAKIRASIPGLARSFLRWKILTCVGLMAGYTVGLVALLATVGMWHWGLAKDTVLWFFLSALVSVMEFVTGKDDENVFARIAIDNLKVVILVEFLVSAYTFPLVVELVLQVFLLLVVTVDAVARTDPKFANVATLTGILLGVIGIAIVGYSLTVAIADWKNLLTFETLRSVLLAPILSIAFAPFIYVLLLVSLYEDIFVRLRFGLPKPNSVVSYGKRRIIAHHGLSLDRLRRFRRMKARWLVGVQTTEDIDRLFTHDDESIEADEAELTDADSETSSASGSAESSCDRC